MIPLGVDANPFWRIDDLANAFDRKSSLLVSICPQIWPLGGTLAGWG
jgi:hypothetical protein